MSKYQEAEMQYKQNDRLVGRVISQNRFLYQVLIDREEKVGKVCGKLQYGANNKEDYPVVGDWVIYKENGGEVIIEEILPRKTMISRKVAGGRSDLQVLATNMDKVLITMAFNNDFNLRRLERYLAIAWESGAIPMILLTKSDLCEDIAVKVESIEQIAFGVDILAVSSLTGEGFEALRQSIKSEETVVFIGSSGVGKSSIVNKLMGRDIQMIKAIDEHDKGRHTTTHRELFELPEGGMVIDTPGMRELQFSQGDMETTFHEIELLSEACYFSDCTHTTEPKCAIREAIENGGLLKERYGSYVKLRREMEIHEARKRHKEKVNFKKHTIKKKVVIEKYDSGY